MNLFLIKTPARKAFDPQKQFFICAILFTQTTTSVYHRTKTRTWRVVSA
jgi:hypothetical protein